MKKPLCFLFVFGALLSMLSMSTTQAVINHDLSAASLSGSVVKPSAPELGDFRISVEPYSQTVMAGGSARFQVKVTHLSGTPGPVSLSVSLPSGWSHNFDPPSGTPDVYFYSWLTITTPSSAPLRVPAAPSTYILTVTGTGMGTTDTDTIKLHVKRLRLTLDLEPQVVSKGSSLMIRGTLSPSQATTLRLYYRYPHETGTWKLATTLNTGSTGSYSRTVTVPTSLAAGDYDLKTVWFNETTGTGKASPITVLTITEASSVTELSTPDAEASLDWNIETVDSTGRVGECNSIALSSSDRPYISYVNYSYPYKLLYAARRTYPASPPWGISTVDSSSSYLWYTSLAVTSDGLARISYNDFRGDDLKYVKERLVPYPLPRWYYTTVDSAGRVGMYNSLALDSIGNPRISYYDATNGDLKYAGWHVLTGWTKEVVDSTGDVGHFTSLTLDSNDNPHIAYYDYTNGYLKYARWTGSTWHKEVIDSFVGNPNGFCSLALDSDDDPRISYWDREEGVVKYAVREYIYPYGWIWSKTVIDSNGLWNSLALDSHDNPHISYSSPDGLKYATAWYLWGYGWIWSKEVVDPTGDCSWNSIALDSMDCPHISYFNGAADDLKYATTAGWGLFSVSVHKPSQTVAAGGSTSHTVTVSHVGGNPGQVTLSLNMPSSLGSYSFSPQTGATDLTSKLEIRTLSTAPPGTYTLTVTAKGYMRKKTDTATITLTVTPLKLTLNCPHLVWPGASVAVSGQLIPGKATSIRLYYRHPYETDVMKLATTIPTDPTGSYTATGTVSDIYDDHYDLAAIWFDKAEGTYVASPTVYLWTGEEPV